MANLDKTRVVTATKWSAVTEIAAKLISPVSTMLLARLLAPDAFGVLVTATMVISFAEIFTDAGFQKYIIQHEFKDDTSLYKSTAVAFWSNLILSIIIWLGIVVFSPQIAHLVGNDGYGLVVAVSCICIPLSAFSSIQMALFKRSMDFRTLFLVRIVGILIPLLVTVPLAFFTHSYWSLIIGMIALNLSNAVLLTWKSRWKPRWFYDVKLFREMFSFTAWSMFEAISIWATGYADIFIVGTMLSVHYMGLYRTSTSLVGSMMGIITAATTPVLFSALSRLQDNNAEFLQMFFRFQKIVGLLVIPMGVGIYLFRDFITSIMLGEQWHEAAYFIGWWGLTDALTIVLSHYCSEVFRAKGHPKFSVLAQCLHICFLVPTVYIAAQYDFKTLCLSRSLVRFTLVGINLSLLYILMRISPLKMIGNFSHSLLAAATMFAVYMLLPSTDNIAFTLLYILLCSITYIGVSMLFPTEKDIILNLKTIIKR